MAKYKRWEESLLKSLERPRAVRHSRRPFRGTRGVACEECGNPLHPTHAFAMYGGWCWRCWEFLQVGEEVVVIDGWGL